MMYESTDQPEMEQKLGCGEGDSIPVNGADDADMGRHREPICFHKSIEGLVAPCIKNVERIIGRDALTGKLRSDAYLIDTCLLRKGLLPWILQLFSTETMETISGAHAALVRLGRRWETTYRNPGGFYS